MSKDVKAVLLHHSTGGLVWQGGVPEWFEQHNAGHATNYRVVEQAFPKKEPYGWKNYPYDYWNIWVEHAGEEPFMEESTLETLTRQYDVIIWKHCYPVCAVIADTGNPDVRSEEKRSENYKLQYGALKAKMREFPDTRFIVWTGAALVQNNTDEASAKRARAFFEWARDEWDEPGDNIYIWDLYELETEGGIYLKDEYAASPDNSHPNEAFTQRVAPFFGQRIVDVIEGSGDRARVTGR